MTTILALDTATTACSVALYHDGATLHRLESSPREHTRLVLPMVDSLLVEAGIPLASIDALAFTAGPGSFTGLRIGFGVIQGLAFGADIPVVPVSTLAALTLAGAERAGLGSGVVMPALDARMGEVYWGVYRIEGDRVEVLTGDQVSAPARVSSAVAVDLGVGDGWKYLEETLAVVQVDSAATPDAVSVARLALPRFASGEALAIDQARLAYVRNEVSWRKRQKIRRP